MSQGSDRAEAILALARTMFNSTGNVNRDHLRALCAQNGITLTEIEANIAAIVAREFCHIEEAIEAICNTSIIGAVGTIGGQSRVCACGMNRVYVHQTSLWVCPKCQRSISIEASRN